jgi:hypothetical protein
MHIQWHIAGNKTQEEKNSNDEDEAAATATQKGGGKKAYSNPNKDKTCNHCKKKGHVETKCWKKHPKLIPDKAKVARKKQAETNSEKSSAAATAINEGEIIHNMIELENENINLFHFDMNDAYYTVLIKEDIMHLQDIFNENGEESDNEESDDDDTSPYIAALNDQAKVEIEVQEDNTWDLDLSLSIVANVIADSTLPTVAHILDAQDIWIADTGATSHISKHEGGGQKHHQTSVRTCGSTGETIKPDCEMDIPVIYCDKEGTEKFDVVLGDVQTNERFNFKLFSVTKDALERLQVKR